MNTAIRWIIRGLALIVVLTGLYATHLFLKPISKIKASLSQAAVAEALTVDGEQFRDLNRNARVGREQAPLAMGVSCACIQDTRGPVAPRGKDHGPVPAQRRGLDSIRFNLAEGFFEVAHTLDA